MIGQKASAESTLAVRRACDELSRKLRAGILCHAEEFLHAELSLTSDTDAALELVYTEFVVREQLGQQPEVREWLERFPQWRIELSQIFEVHDAVAQRGTRRANLSRTQYEAADTSNRADSLVGNFRGGYQVLEEIGRGGMGIVYRARQLSLNRIVALKMMLLPEGQRERARFRTEAEATARLSHPNIVQIYEVGQEGEHPFLSMEFIAGKSLDKELAASTLAPRTAAELALVLARAVAYAHQCGIIHRDLKPANILLAANGTPKITDFGLAKTLSENEAPAQSVAIVGTPSYMAPEQSRAGSQVGPAADVYALGAILYETLTRRPPFCGESAFDILEQVRTQEPVSPTRLARKTPRDLETICLKCLAKQPSQRYASATQLADDLERFLEGKPIFARQVGRIERTVRWCWRNPVVGALTGGIALALIGGTIVSSSLAVWALNEKERAAKHARHAIISAEQEQAARELAEYRFAQAEKAVEQYLDGIEKQERLKEADFLDLRKQLLTSAVPFYEEFLSQKPRDAALEARRGRAYGRLAVLRSQLGEQQRAVTDFQQMKRIFQKLANQSPDLPEHRQQLVRSNLGLSQSFYELGKREEAAAEVRQAVTAAEDLVAAYPARDDFRQDLAKSRMMLGIVLDGQGSSEAAIAEYHKVVELAQPLADRYPANPAYRLDLAGTHNNLANVLSSLGKRAEAADEMRRALALEQALAAEFPKAPIYRQRLAKSHYNLGVFFSRLRQWDQCELELRQSTALGKTLAEDFPTVPAYRLELAHTRYSLGRLLRDRARPAEAEIEYRQALELRESLKLDTSDVPEYRADLANSHAGLGSVLNVLGKTDQAIEAFRQALEVWTALFEALPDELNHRASMASHLNSLAVILRREGRRDEARQFHEQAIEQRLILLQAAPDNRAYASSLSGYYREFGETALAQKDHRAAAQAAHQSAEVRLDIAPNAELAIGIFARCMELANQDTSLGESEREALARSYCDQGIEQLRAAVRGGYNNVAALKSLTALAPLREKPEFQQIVRELETR